MIDKPSIVETIGARLHLRRAGKEYVGLCPFHADKHPSFKVNEEKGVFHCFGCGAGGDVFDFVMKVEGVSFTEAMKLLGVNHGVPEGPKPNPTRWRAAARLADWLNNQHLKVGILLRVLSQQIALAERIPDPELAASFTQEWEILSDLYEDLQNSSQAESLFRARDFIESITAEAEIEPLPTFPEITAEYRQFLRSKLC